MEFRPAEDRSRLRDRIAAWRIEVDRIEQTETSYVAFGYRDAKPVVLKVVKRPAEEWRSGAILAAFDGGGVVRVYEHVEGAMLLECLRPGEPLAGMALGGRDEEATRVLANTMLAMAPRATVDGVPTVADWGRAFEGYAASADTQVPSRLLAAARRRHAELCASQTRVRLLHGDLHHYNVLHDAGRGWLAVDPKGVLGEPEYEAGALLRNPFERPELFVSAPVIRSRVNCLARSLDLDDARVLSWAFVQAVLSVVWEIEDGIPIRPDNGRLALAKALQRMLPGPCGD